jgi:hypothetical protein
MEATMTVDTSIGDTLICTVGLSPTPVALSVRLHGEHAARGRVDSATRGRSQPVPGHRRDGRDRRAG